MPHFPAKGLLHVFQNENFFSDKLRHKCLYAIIATISDLCVAAVNFLFQFLLQCCVKRVIVSVHN
jgi:hypothetical protein